MNIGAVDQAERTEAAGGGAVCRGRCVHIRAGAVGCGPDTEPELLFTTSLLSISTAAPDRTALYCRRSSSELKTGFQLLCRERRSDVLGVGAPGAVGANPNPRLSAGQRGRT